MMSYFANEFSQKYKNDNEQLTTRLAEVENENMRRQAEIAQLQERSVQERSVQLQEINVQLQDRNTELMYITQEYQNVEEDISPKINLFHLKNRSRCMVLKMTLMSRIRQKNSFWSLKSPKVLTEVFYPTLDPPSFVLIMSNSFPQRRLVPLLFIILD
ncbi:hypothetical protein JTE90_000369 [Oedothorax gibbosus]|uniref:Uncharacterized protein n=1 Tax=Oedothorax gibbosus TaxID=931172 RepID=A0AAV6TSM7_9ARAC|nr:hypothetical protein JTE90_000369 [Oedothorax gibbosus]